jgi:chromosome segregation ATPase
MKRKEPSWMKQLSSIQLQQQIIHYKSELEKYKQKCSLLEKNSLAQKYKSLKKDHQILENTLEEYRTQFKKIDAEKEQLSSKYQTFFKAQEKEMTKLRYTINQLKDQLHKTNQTHLTEKNKQTEHQNETKDALEKEIISLQVTNCYLTKEIELLLINKQQIEKQLYIKESELLELEVLGEELQREWNAHKQHLLILNSFEEHKNCNLLNQNDSLKTQLYLRETELMELEEQLEKLKIEWGTTKQHLLILNSFAEHKNCNLLGQKESLKAQLYFREIELYEVQQTLLESTSHYEDLLTIKANQLEQASKMQIEKSAYIQKIETSLQKLLDEKMSYTNTLHALRKNIKLMKEDVFSFQEEESAAIKNKMKSYENTIQHLQFTNAHLIEEINKLKNRAPK